MDSARRTEFEQRAEILKAMAHPTRLYIVHLLEQSELCVQDITARVGADMSTVSRHLSILKGVRIIAADKRGAKIYYSLRTRCVMGFFQCVEAVINDEEGEQCGCFTLPKQRH